MFSNHPELTTLLTEVSARPKLQKGHEEEMGQTRLLRDCFKSSPKVIMIQFFSAAHATFGQS